MNASEKMFVVFANLELEKIFLDFFLENVAFSYFTCQILTKILGPEALQRESVSFGWNHGCINVSDKTSLDLGWPEFLFLQSIIHLKARGFSKSLHINCFK